MRTLTTAYKFWHNKTSPFNNESIPGHYEKWAAEVKILVGDQPISKVLEIGCGTGAFFSLLGFHTVDYTGIDLSDSMLSIFRQKFPNARLICGSGHSYIDKKQYDTILSITVLQYFDLEMIDLHFRNVKQMLQPNGSFYCCSIPWRVHRLAFYSGEISNPLRKNWVKMLRGFVRSVRGDPLGIWHKPSELEKIANRHGLSGRYFGSVLYPYRFHAVLTHAV